jgi:ribonuclease H / adenosylcobalamin/alpha-ribazole phosphatase
VIEQLVLVRHGETVHNAAGIAQGWNDSALSDKGAQQVLRLAQRIARMQPNALFSSPLSRALATARAIADATGLEVRTLDELREMNYGGWEGKSFLDVRRDDEDIYRRWIDDADCPCPGGESHNDLRSRMARAFDAIEASANGQPLRAVAVSHGTAIRVAATVLLDVPTMSSRHFAQDNAAINLFVRRGGRPVMKLWNDTSHCEP